MTPTDDLDARQAELLDELDGLTRRASIGHDGVWENERRRVIHLELSRIDPGARPPAGRLNRS